MKKTIFEKYIKKCFKNSKMKKVIFSENIYYLSLYLLSVMAGSHESENICFCDFIRCN